MASMLSNYPGPVMLVAIQVSLSLPFWPTGPCGLGTVSDAESVKFEILREIQMTKVFTARIRHTLKGMPDVCSNNSEGFCSFRILTSRQDTRRDELFSRNSSLTWGRWWLLKVSLPLNCHPYWWRLDPAILTHAFVLEVYRLVLAPHCI